MNIDSPNYVDIHRTVTCDAENFTMICPTKLVTERESTIDADTTIDIKVLIDCGVEGHFIDQTYATIMGIKKLALDTLIKAWNIDGDRLVM